MKLESRCQLPKFKLESLPRTRLWPNFERIRPNANWKGLGRLQRNVPRELRGRETGADSNFFINCGPTETNRWGVDPCENKFALRPHDHQRKNICTIWCVGKLFFCPSNGNSPVHLCAQLHFKSNKSQLNWHFFEASAFFNSFSHQKYDKICEIHENRLTLQ